MSRVANVLLVALCTLCATATAHAEDTIRSLVERFTDAHDPADRVLLVPRIAALDTEAAAKRLARIVREDPAHDVRCEAARSLGKMQVDEAAEQLLQLAVWGGVRDLRVAVGRGLAGRTDGAPRIDARLAKPGLDALARERLIDVLSDIGTDYAAASLDARARSADAADRCAALRAMSRMRSARSLVSELLPETLVRFTDLDTVMTALDIAADAGDARVRPATARLATSASPCVRAAADAVLARLDYRDALARRKPVPGKAPSRYAPAPADDDEPLPPPPRPRVELVYLFDCTGSVSGYLPTMRKLIADELRPLIDLGCDLRVAVVAYREAKPAGMTHGTQILPLTYDMAQVNEFLEQIEARGTDSRGTDYGLALHDGLNRMSWRPNARHRAVIVADSKCGDPERAVAVAGDHFRNDRTVMSIWYLARTRTKVPDDLAELARAAGGDASDMDLPTFR